MEKELTIIIAGKTNTGKSTMMLQIEKLLKANGFDVELSFENHPDYSGNNSVYFHQREERNFDEKINAIKGKTKIILKEMQINSHAQNQRIETQIEV